MRLLLLSVVLSKARNTRLDAFEFPGKFVPNPVLSLLPLFTPHKSARLRGFTVTQILAMRFDSLAASMYQRP
jgi:hypothetical protein